MTGTTAFAPAACRVLTVERQLTAVIPARVPMDKIPEAQRSLRAKIAAALPGLNVGPLGHACTLWRPPADGHLYMEPGVIVSHSFEPSGEVVASALPGGRAAHFRLAGPYDGLPGAWKTVLDWCAGQELKLAGINWEIYGDWNEDPAKLETSLYASLV